LAGFIRPFYRAIGWQPARAGNRSRRIPPVRRGALATPATAA